MDKIPENKNNDELLIKEIADKNLTAENKFLIENGFKNLKRNLRLLLKFDKNKEKALSVLKANKLKKLSKKYLEKIEKLGFQEQNAFLISKGHLNNQTNCKKLEKFNGDKDKALEALNKKTLKDLKNKVISQEINKLGYKTQNESLISNGYTKLDLNLKILKRSKGIFKKALKIIKKKCEKKKIKETLKDIISPDSWNKKMNKELKLKLKEEYKSWFLTEIQPNTKIVYVDGVNLIMSNKHIRNLFLKNKSKDAEKILNDLASEFVKLFNIEELVIVFDKINQPLNTNVGSCKFSTKFACPNFKTTEEALYNWVGGLSNYDNVLIVSSDLGLQMKLKEKGVKMTMKVTCWVNVLKKKLGKEKFKKMFSIEGIESEMKSLSIEK